MSPSLPFPVVDIHNHVISADLDRFPTAPMGGKQSDWSKERPVDAEGMLRAMRDAGVAQSVLVQASTCYGHDNRYVEACVKAHPGAFAGVFSADFAATDAIERIAHWMQTGMSGARVFVAGHTAADASVQLDDPRAFPTWDYLTQRRIPVSVQLRSDKLDQLEAVLARCPEAVVLLDHCARPELDDGPPYAKAHRLFALAKFPHLVLKYTTHNVRESKLAPATQRSFAQALADRFGVQRLAWGSNFPASSGTLADLLDEALEATAGLGAEAQAWIFSRTARTLYPALELA